MSNPINIILLLIIVGFFAMRFLRSNVPVEQAHALVANGAKLVDVRTPGEFAASHVPGAVNIPVGELGNRLKELGDPSAPIVLYCRSGARSARASGILKKAGFESVHDVGAMSRW